MKNLLQKASGKYVLNSMIIYVVILAALFCTSKGLNTTDIALLFRMGIPVAILTYAVQTGVEKNIFSRVYIPHLFVGFSWIISGPVLFYIVHHDAMRTIYNGHDIFFGIYLSLLLIAMQNIALSILRKPRVAMGVSLFAIAMLTVPVLQSVYFMAAGTTISNEAMAVIQHTNVLEIVLYGQSVNGMLILVSLFLFICCLAAAFRYSDKKVMEKAIWGEKPSGKRIILIAITVILLVYMFYGLIWHTEFFARWIQLAGK
jgi:hypothetical protein